VARSRVANTEIYLDRAEEGGKMRQKYESGMAKNPPLVNLQAVCFVASNHSGDKEYKQHKQ
jgi:hypothetical protein